MKLDIENKILIPFMILAVLPIIILGIFSFWNGYQLVLNSTSKYMEASLNEALSYIEITNDKVSDGILLPEDAKSEAIEYLRSINKNNLIITSDGVVLLNNSKFTRLPSQLLNKADSGSLLNEQDSLYLYHQYDDWNWTVAIAADKQLMLGELLDIQKYILLMAIIFLVISMQAIIFIAHNISKPIKYFAEVCKKIEINNMNKVILNRSDEIGVLAKSFNTMIDQLNDSTENLIEMKKFNEDILENISIGIMTTDNDGNHLSINNAGNKIFTNHKNKDAISSVLQAQIRETLNEKHSISRIATIGTEQGGSMVYLDVSTSLLKKDSEHITGAICSFSDITSRKNIENNFVRVNRLAYVGQFAAGLAHEIRNPLTGIKTSIQVIRNRLDDRHDSSSTELAEGIIYEIDRINNLITELLDFSKVKNTNQQNCRLADVLNKTLSLCSEEIDQKHIQVQLDSFDASASVLVDSGHAEQIFLNIITNAIQSMDDNGKLEISVSEDHTRFEPYILVSFRDNGLGIDSEIREKIFDPFFTTKSKGTGLGLSVVARLLEENNGYIELESTKGIGSNFKVYLQQIKEANDENKNTGH